jgi:hypothetical protein
MMNALAVLMLYALSTATFFLYAEFIRFVHFFDTPIAFQFACHP